MTEVNINKKGENENTPLHFAILNKSNGVAEILCKYGADVNLKNFAHNSPLHLAVDN